MKEYSKKEIDSKFGKNGFFAGASKRLFELNFIGGEDFLERNNEQGIKGTKLEILKDGSIEINTGSWETSAVIERKNLLYITIEKQETILEEKSKSIVGRALLGGLLLGPVGAVVGGMTGIGEKTVKDKQMPDYIIVFKIVDDFNQKEKVILFECNNKDFSTVNKFISSNLAEKVIEPSTIQDEQTHNNVHNTADQLIKLKNLLNEGILTEGEFEKEKQKILNK